MSLPQIAIIRISDAQKTSLPCYGNPVGTSMTLLASNIDSVKIAPNHYQVIDTGLAIALPIGLEAQVRSLKQSTQTGVFVLNAPLTIDASDRCEIKVCLYNASNESVIIKNRDPIALLVFSPAVRVQWKDLSAVMTQRRAPEEPEVSETVEPSSDDTEYKQEVDDQSAIPHLQDNIPVINTNVSPEVQQELSPNEVETPAIVKQFQDLESNFYDTNKNEINSVKDHVDDV